MSFGGHGMMTEGGGRDPFWGYVKLLLACDGVNLGTAFPDASPVGRTITVNGGALTSTGLAKFGSASLYCEGTNSYLSAADSADWNASGDLTWEAHIQINVTTAQFFFGQRVDGSNFTMLQLTGGKFHFASGRSGVDIVNLYSTTTPATVNFYHVAVTRQSDTYRLFVDGVLEYTGVGSGVTVTDLAAPFIIGAQVYDASKYFDGHADNVRVTQGIARYTAAFTPPTAAYPVQ